MRACVGGCVTGGKECGGKLKESVCVCVCECLCVCVWILCWGGKGNESLLITKMEVIIG